MVFSAEAFEVRCTRGAGRPGNGVVDVGGGGGLVTAGEAAGHVATAHEFLQCCRRPVAGFGRGLAGVCDRTDLGAVEEGHEHGGVGDAGPEYVSRGGAG